MGSSVGRCGRTCSVAGLALPIVLALSPAASAGSSTIQLSATQYDAREGDTNVTLTVERTGSTAGTATVEYSTEDGSESSSYAEARSQLEDYASAAGTLTFEPGAASRTITVPVGDDNDVETAEAFTVELAQVSGAEPGTPKRGVVRLLDNDGIAYAVTDVNELVSFPPSDPADTTTPLVITGLAPGEQLLGIDFRPATSELYGLGSTSRLYVIDRETGLAEAVGEPGEFVLSGDRFGFDFMGRVDQVRVVSDADQNIRIDPDGGTLLGTDEDLFYPESDLGFGANPAIAAIAYFDIPYSGVPAFFGIDGSGRDALIVHDENPIGGGDLHTLGSLGASVTDAAMDAHQFGPTTFAAVAEGNDSVLYPADVDAGALVTDLKRTIAVDDPVSGLALGPAGELELDADEDVVVQEEAGSAPLTITREWGTVGEVSVGWGWSGESPPPGVPGGGVVTFADGQSSATFDVPLPPDDDIAGPGRIIIIRLGRARGGALVDSFQGPRARIEILDTDPVQDRALDLSAKHRRSGSTKLVATPDPCPEHTGARKVILDGRPRGGEFERLGVSYAEDCKARLVRRFARSIRFVRARMPATQAFNAATSNRVRIPRR